MTKPTPDLDRFKKLPKPVDLEETVETVDVDPHAPPEHPDQETAWMLKHGGF